MKRETKINKINNYLKSNKINKYVKYTLITLVIFLLIFLLFKFSTKFNHKEDILNFGFENVGELVTQEWYGRILESTEKNRKLFNKIKIPFTNSRIIFSLDVEVTAGIDFKEIEYKLLNNNVLKIILPKAKIYKYYQVPNSFKDYLDEESWFTEITSKERHTLENEMINKGKKIALDSGILNKADKNAKSIIEQMIKSKNSNLKIEWSYK